MTTIKLAEFISTHPFCCLCGGHEPATEQEHVPSRQFFHDKNRPSQPGQLVVPSCKPCNQGTGQSDQIFALLCRGLREYTRGELDIDRMAIWIKGLGLSNPEVVAEWPPTGRMRRRAGNLNNCANEAKIFPINIGRITMLHIQAVGAKLGLALHWHMTGRIASKMGGVIVNVYTADDTLSGRSNLGELISDFGEWRTLHQGNVKVEDQFRWRSGISDTRSAHHVEFGVDCAMLIYVADTDRALLPRGPYIHKPGELLSFRHPDDLGSLSAKWEQPLFV